MRKVGDLTMPLSNMTTNNATVKKFEEALDEALGEQGRTTYGVEDFIFVTNINPGLRDALLAEWRMIDEDMK